MNNSTEPTLKMRFRLPHGEEFEAEGSLEFIESQRNSFLRLIGHSEVNVSPASSLPNIPSAQQQHTEQYLWERILKEDGNTLILRNKTKSTTAEIAILLLAGARVLLKREEYSALELSKSLKASGIEGGRLDRMLASAIQAGYLFSQGSKRGRTYRISESGFAKAYILADKLSQNRGGR